jgi:hypothetical protein
MDIKGPYLLFELLLMRSDDKYKPICNHDVRSDAMAHQRINTVSLTLSTLTA